MSTGGFLVSPAWAELVESSSYNARLWRQAARYARIVEPRAFFWWGNRTPHWRRVFCVRAGPLTRAVPEE